MINLRYRLPANLENTASVTAAADWMLVQKDGEEFLSKIPAGTFGPMLASSLSGLTDTNTGIAFPGSDVIQFLEGAAECARFTADGEFSSGDGALLKRPGQGSTTLPVYSFQLDPNTGVGNHGADAVGIYTNGALRVGFSSTAILPATTNAIRLGNTDLRYSEIWCTQTSINSSSDMRLKADIADSDLGLNFVNALRPVRFRWIVGDRIEQEDGSYADRAGVRPHYGLLAQEVRLALDAIACEDFAGYCYDEASDSYSLRMAEFIAPLIKAVQELAARVEELEAQLGVGEA